MITSMGNGKKNQLSDADEINLRVHMFPQLVAALWSRLGKVAGTTLGADLSVRALKAYRIAYFEPNQDSQILSTSLGRIELHCENGKLWALNVSPGGGIKNKISIDHEVKSETDIQNAVDHIMNNICGLPGSSKKFDRQKSDGWER